LSTIVSSQVSGDDTVDWWKKFPQIKASLNTGLVSGTKLLICGWDSFDGPTGKVVGTADLSSHPSVTHVLSPVVATGRDDNENDVDTQTSNIRNEDSYITRGTARISIAPVPVKTKKVERIKDEAKNVERDVLLHYNGLYFSISVGDLRNGDIIEFGGDGTQYHTWASWSVVK
jgi:hypothetical protein